MNFSKFKQKYDFTQKKSNSTKLKMIKENTKKCVFFIFVLKIKYLYRYNEFYAL